MELDVFVAPLFTIFLWGFLLFLLSVLYKDNSIADIAWGPGFIFLSWGSVLWPLRLLHVVALVAVTIWGMRLFLRLYLRKKLVKGEDSRYNIWRKNWGKFFYIRSYLQIFLLQPFLLLINASVLILFLSHPRPDFSLLMILGSVLWIVGFCHEIVADYQLDSFHRQKAAGLTQQKFCQTGLWKYSRHPNYFGEVILWWGIFFFCAPTIGYFAAVSSPLIITILILFVSGIPMAEARRRDDPAYLEYKMRTSPFFPNYFRSKK